MQDIFPIPIAQDLFVDTAIVSIYSKILTDVLERTHGLTDDQVSLLLDNCVKSNSTDGVITLLAKAMSKKSDLFLVYDKAIGVVRLATSDEKSKIEEDYKKQAKSSAGVYVTFKNFSRSDMVRFYLLLEFCTVGSLYKAANVSKAIQLKFKDIRKSTSLTDSPKVKTQAEAIAKGLADGKDIMLDAEDSVEMTMPPLEAVKASNEFTQKQQAFYLGLPSSYLDGVQTSGIGSTGEGDMRAVERGLKSYYYSIMKPVVDAIFGVTVTYKSQDIRHILGSQELLKTFSLTDDQLISKENKTKMINRVFDLPDNAKGDEPKRPPAALPAAIPAKDPAK